MGDMFDAVDWANLPPLNPPAVAGYLDGPKSAWPAQAWNTFQSTPHLVISVLADPRANVMDVEYGNAPAANAAAAARRHLDQGTWTVMYCGESNMAGVASACQAAGTPLQPGSAWPRPGTYLWCADPTNEPHLAVAWAPVEPVAVQDRWKGGYDISSTLGSFPALPAPVNPVAHPTPAPVVAILSDGTGRGYWLVGADGGVFTYGPLPFYGSLGGHKLAAPIVGAEVTPAGKGYWLVGADGGVFCFGDATFRGSLG